MCPCCCQLAALTHSSTDGCRRLSRRHLCISLHRLQLHHPAAVFAIIQVNNCNLLPVYPMSDVISILSAIEKGDGQAAEQLLPLVYDELRKLAAGKLAQEKPGQTLQATALYTRHIPLDPRHRSPCHPVRKPAARSTGHLSLPPEGCMASSAPSRSGTKPFLLSNRLF